MAVVLHILALNTPGCNEWALASQSSSTLQLSGVYSLWDGEKKTDRQTREDRQTESHKLLIVFQLNSQHIASLVDIYAVLGAGSSIQTCTHMLKISIWWWTDPRPTWKLCVQPFSPHAMRYEEVVARYFFMKKMRKYFYYENFAHNKTGYTNR